MTDQELLDMIHGTPWIADLLTLFDFEIARAADGPIEPVTLPGGEQLATAPVDIFSWSARTTRIREDWPELDDDRDRLRETLGLPPVDVALLRSLQAAAADLAYRPINEQGKRFRPMLAWREDAEEAQRPVAPASLEHPAPPAVRREEPMPGQLGLF